MKKRLIGGIALLASLLSACSDGELEVSTQGERVEAGLEREWVPDGSPVRQSAFSRDGRMLATGSASGRVTLRETESWRVVADLIHAGGATSLAFSSDGRRLYTAGYDGNVRAWDVAGRREIGLLAGAAGTIWTIDISPDGRRLAAAGEDKIIRIWRLDRRAEPMRLTGHERNIWEVRFSPDGSRLASGSFDATARLWDAGTGAHLRTLTGHEEAVVGLAYSADGRLLATGGDDSTIRLWRAADGAPLRTIESDNHVHKIAFSPDGRWLAGTGRARSNLGAFWHALTGAGGEVRPVHLWRVADGALVQALPHSGDVMYAAFSPDGRRLVTGGEDGRARLWRIREKTRGR